MPAGSAGEALGLELVREMRRLWRRGERPAAEDFLNQRPELWERPEVAVELVYEEYCLRQGSGQSGVEEDILRRFPQWAGPLRVMLECHCLLQSDREPPQFPVVGETVGDFKLLAELGGGAHGRVFLASQTGLADRPVVLKITPLEGGEHLSLARLQHTNIVPLYAAFDDISRGVRILCMPYLGRATLAVVLQSLADVSLTTRTGRHIVAAIDRAQADLMADCRLTTAGLPAELQSSIGNLQSHPARQMLERVSYVQGLCWITACLADALQFAHERGLLHLDLKPMNVLLTGDGQPMLLDFHLARAPVLPGGPLPDRLGGTPGYMPPELHAATQARGKGQPIQTPVDGRADIYALGATLYQSLGGRLPITADAPPLAQVNPNVSPGLSDIVGRCVAHRPEDRYTTAAALADDLRRHLMDQPLVGVSNRSIAERWRKWRRRRPNAMRTAAMIALVAGAAALLLAGAGWQMGDRRQQAEHALRHGQAHLQKDGHSAEAVRTFERGLALAEGLPFQRDLRMQLRDQLATARRRHIADQLHVLADDVRSLYGTDSLPTKRLRSLASHCRRFWEKRHLVVDSLSSTQDPDVTTDLKDIAIFAADLQVRLAAGSESAADRHEALRLLNEAEELFGPSAVLEHERQVHGQALGLPRISGTASPAPRTAWEHCALGRAYLAAGDLARASETLAVALRLDPAGRWANFYYGLCAYRNRRNEEALSAFSVCIGTAPNSAPCFSNRGLAHAALGRPDPAMRDYDRALQIDPTLAAAALNRGLLRFDRKHYDQALADLDLALKNGADAASVHYTRAQIYVAANNHAAALDNLRQALQHNPSHEQARQLRDMLPYRTADDD